LLASTIAGHIGLTLHSLNLRDELQSEAMHDALTGLFNRRYLEATLQREVERANRGASHLGVVMFDLDHFKAVNDRFGHATGDQLLREFSSRLRGATRAGDIAARYGGEEFVLVMAGASLESARARAEQLRTTMNDLPLPEQLGRVGTVTVSAGVAALPEHGADADSLLSAADVALYRAKENGRNQVVVADYGPTPVPLARQLRREA
jgi:diguanylate cyclase (GGDEF)-like protein